MIFEIESIGGQRNLQLHMYRSNYLVLAKEMIEEMPDEWHRTLNLLMAEFAHRFPIVAQFNYEIRRIDDPEYCGCLGFDQAQTTPIGGAIVAPCSLLYSMPDRWQSSLHALIKTIVDPSYYLVELPDRIDPFGYRHDRFDSDAVD